VQEWVNKYKACPVKVTTNHLKQPVMIILMQPGYFTFGVTKYIDVQFGYDKNFIGNGYRSLFFK
jgi:hypothetical protein